MFLRVYFLHFLIIAQFACCLTYMFVFQKPSPCCCFRALISHISDTAMKFILVFVLFTALTLIPTECAPIDPPRMKFVEFKPFMAIAHEEPNMETTNASELTHVRERRSRFDRPKPNTSMTPVPICRFSVGVLHLQNYLTNHSSLRWIMYFSGNYSFQPGFSNFKTAWFITGIYRNFYTFRFGNW